jgi:hypothetical protein
VRLVHNEHGGHLHRAPGSKKVAQVKQQFVFAFARRREPEVGENVLQEFRRSQPAIEKIRVGNVLALLQQPEQASQQQGLARAHFSRQDNKSLVLPNAMIKRRQRLVVPLGRDKTNGIGCQVERIAREFEKDLYIQIQNLAM